MNSSTLYTFCGGGKDSPINDDDINGIFHVLDPDDNGTITYGEFTYQFYNRRSIVKKQTDSIISNGSLSLQFRPKVCGRGKKGRRSTQNVYSNKRRSCSFGYSAIPSY